MSYIKSLNGMINTPITSTGEGTSTSNLSVTKLHSTSISQATFNDGDFISFEAWFGRSGSAANTTARLYLNNADTLTGAIQVATRTIATTQGSFYLSRRLFFADIRGAGSGNSIGTQVIGASLNYGNDYQQGITTNLLFDWFTNGTVYLITAGFVSNAADSITSYGLRVFKY